MNKKEFAAMFDHTILKADATKSLVAQACEEAVRIGAASVCINPCNVGLAASLLSGSGVKVCTVIGFPLGANTTAVKAFETRDAIRRGAEEIDMVINIGALLSGDMTLVSEDIRAVVQAAGGLTTKVIIETCYLDEPQIEIACRLAQAAGADFVKTSTGFGPSGAKASDIRLMRKAIGNSMKIKASGGIRNYAVAMEMVEASADRLGVSASLAILEGAD